MNRSLPVVLVRVILPLYCSLWTLRVLWAPLKRTRLNTRSRRGFLGCPAALRLGSQPILVAGRTSQGRRIPDLNLTSSFCNSTQGSPPRYRNIPPRLRLLLSRSGIPLTLHCSWV